MIVGFYRQLALVEAADGEGLMILWI